jgi:DNA topoisomerase-3
VARRFLAVFYPDAEFASTELVVRVGPGEPTPDASPSHGAEAAEREGSENTSTRDDDPSERLLDALPPFPDHFVARGRVRLVAGWQEVAGLSGDDETPARAGAAGDRSPAREAEPEQSLPKLREGDRLEGSFEPLAKQTRPPSRYTEATLLGAMESAGKAIEDEALRQAMKDCGLGTPATRAAIIETLLKRGYVSRDKKHVVPTPLGMALIDALPVQSLASPELTGSWEARLARIARGEDSRDAFMADIAAFVREVVEAIRGAAPPSAPSVTPEPGPRVGRCPRCGGDVVERVRDYACAVGARPCGFSLPKLIARRAISPALASVLLGQKRTQVLRGFKSKQGRSFAAALVLDEGGEVRFVFAYGGEPTISPPDSSHEAPASPPPAPPPPRPRATAARVAKPSARPRASEPAPPAADLAGLVCPRCKQGALVTGKRGWGCARWREGCGFVVWFETAGRRITATQLRELIEKGRTRKGRWTPGNGPPVPGHLVLDVTAQGGAVRFEPAAPPRSRVNR